MNKAVPLYDRRRLEAMVMEHKMRVHRMQRSALKAQKLHSGVKAPR